MYKTLESFGQVGSGMPISRETSWNGRSASRSGIT